MGKKSPPPPNYAAAAQAQGQANKDSALQTAVLSNPNVYTPYGSQTVTWGNQQPSYQLGGSGGQVNQNLMDQGPGGMAQTRRGNGMARAMQTPDSPRNRELPNGQYGPASNVGGGYGGGGYGGVPQATVRQQFSPTEQAKYDANTGLELSLLDTAQSGLGRVDEMMNTPFSTDGMQQVSSVQGTGGDASLSNEGMQGLTGLDRSQLPDANGYNLNNLPSYGNVNLGGLPQQGNLSTAGLSDQQAVNRTGMQQPESLSASGLFDFQNLNNEGLEQPQFNPQGREFNPLSNQGMQGVDAVDASQLRDYSIDPSVGGLQSVTDAIRARGDEDFARRNEALEADLIARGFQPGTEGFDERMQQLTRQQNDFNTQAILAGGQEQSRLAGLENTRRQMGLGEQQAEYASQMGLRGQQFGERQSMTADAANQRAQQFGEAQGQFNADMMANQNEFGQRQAMAQNASQRRGQEFAERSGVFDAGMYQNQNEFGQRQALSQDARANRAQQFGEQDRMAAFQQSLRAQGLNEQQVAAQMQNIARQGGAQERQQMAAFEMALRQQGMSEQQAQAAVNAAMRSQQFGERASLASFDQTEQQRNFQNQLALQQAQQAERARQMQEQAYLRQMPLNEINALRTGSQAQLPQFQGYSGAQVQAAPTFDAAIAQGNYNLANQRNQTGLGDIAGGLFGAAGAAGGFGPLFGGMFGGGG